MSTLERTTDQDAPLPEDLKRVLDVGESAIAHQFQVAERLDAKARGLVTLAGAWFAVTQAVAGVAYSSKPGNVWLLLLLATTLAAGVELLVTFYFCFQVWKPRKESELTHDGFRKLADQAINADSRFTEEIVTYYQHVLGVRRKNNRDRVERLKHAQTAWVFAVALTFVELIIATLTRLLA